MTPRTTKAEGYLEHLSDLGIRRKGAEAEAKIAMDGIKRLVGPALKAGASKSDIARHAQISRVTLDDFLKGG